MNVFKVPFRIIHPHIAACAGENELYGHILPVRGMMLNIK